MKQVFVTLGSAMALGMFVLSFIDSSKQVILVIACFVLWMISMCVCLKRATFFLFMSGLTVGCMLFYLQDLQYQAVIESVTGMQLLTGQVLEIGRAGGGTWRYVVAVDSLDCNVLLYAQDYMGVQVGDYLQATAELSQPSGGAFDYARYYKSEGVYLTGWVDPGELVAIANPNPSVFMEIARLNVRIGKALDRVLSDDASAVVKSMVLGDRTGLDPILVEKYVASGSYHLFSVSGLHLSVLLMSLSRLIVPVVGRRYSGFALLGILFFFLALSGFHLSTLRSFIMVSVLLLGRLIHQNAHRLNSLCLAVMIILLLDSYAILNVGFLLSAGATFGIVYLFPKMQKRCPNRQDVLARAVQNSILFSTAVTVALLPIYCATFGRFSLSTVISNLVVVPLATALLISSFVLCLLVLWWEPQLLVDGMEWLVAIQNQLVGWIADLPYMTVGLDYPFLQVLVIASVFLIIMTFSCKRRQVRGYQRLSRLSMILVAGCVAFAIFYPQTVNRLYLVGDGAVANLVFVNRGHCVVVCTNDDRYIDEKTLNFLAAKGISNIDHLIYSYDEWRYYRDSHLLIDRMNVEQVWLHPGNISAMEYLNAVLPTQEIHYIDGEVTIEQGDVQLVLDPQENNVNIQASFYNLPICIGSPSFASAQPAALTFLSGANQYTEISTPDTTWLLKEPYTTLEMDLGLAYQGEVYFEFRDDNTLWQGTENAFLS